MSNLNMEMPNNISFLPFHSEVGTECEDFINVEELLLTGDDYPSFLLGSDVSLTNFNMLESDDMFSCVEGDVLSTDHAMTMSMRANSLIGKSPWHDSDSGISETLSSVGSPPGPCSTKTVGEEFCQTETSKSGNRLSRRSDSQTSDELMAFLFDETNTSATASLSISKKSENVTPLSSSGRPLRMSSRQKMHDAEFSFFDSDDSDGQTQDHTSTKLASRSAKSLSSKNEMSMTPSRGNVINIVKLVKPQCSSEATDDDIIQALDNRSKKNAQQAKLNREKKKAYIKSLENERDSLTKENTQLSSQLEDVTQKMVNLEAEVDYLKSVLFNSSALSGLLKNISNVKGVKLTSSFTSRKRGYENDHSYNLVDGRPGKKMKGDSTKAGVCLHVSDGAASLEFCSHCASLSRKTHNYNEIS